MEIKTKIEENPPVQGNNISISNSKRLAKTNNAQFRSNSDDFEACLKELDDNKKTDETQNTVQNNAETAVPKDKKTEAAKDSKKTDEKENVPVRINNIDDIKLFMRKKDLLNGHNSNTKIKLDSLKKKDIEFLRTCLENPSITINNLNPQNLQATFAVQNSGGQVSYKSIEVSKGLFNLIEYSFKAQKPVRLDFNENSSVILKMHNNGKLVAEFISNDKAMEYILKSSIPGLKDKLDSEGIPYEEISYKDNSKKNNDRQNKGGNQ